MESHDFRGFPWPMGGAKDYAYGEQDLLLLFGLEELYEIQDVSLAKDKSMMKKQIKDGDGLGNSCDISTTHR